MKRSRILLVLVALPLVAFQIAAGCGGQGEGQLCSQLNNTNDDCQTPLVCTPIGLYMACCPPPGIGSTNPACMLALGTTSGTGGTGGMGGAGGMGGMPGTSTSSTGGTGTSASTTGASTSTTGSSSSSSVSASTTGSSSSSSVSTSSSSTTGGGDGG